MNELKEMVLNDISNLFIDIMAKYEGLLGLEFGEDASKKAETVIDSAAEAFFKIARSERTDKIDRLMCSDMSYKEILNCLPSLEGLTVEEFVKLCFRSYRNYQIVKETPGGEHKTIFEMIGTRKGDYPDKSIYNSVLQKVEAEDNYFILTYYKK